MQLTLTKLNCLLAFLFLYLLNAGTVNAQLSVADSIQNALKKTQPEPVKALLFARLAENLLRTEPDRAALFSQKAAKIAASDSNKLLQARALNTLGVANLILSNFDKAFESHYKALKIREQAQDSAGMANSMINIGNVYYKLSTIDKCLAYYKNALAIASARHDKKTLSKIYNNLGTVHENLGNNAKALPYFQKSAALKEELKDSVGLSVSLLHIGEVLQANKQTKEGLPYMLKALQLDLATRNDIGRVVVLRTVSEAYQELKEYQNAREFGEQALALARKLHSRSEIMFAADRLQNLYATTGNYRKAYEYLLLNLVYSDSLNNENSLAQRNEIEIRYDTQQKELANQKLVAEKKLNEQELKRKTTVELLISLLAILLLAFVLVLMLSWRRLKHNNRKLQETNLQIQKQNLEISRQQQELCEHAAIVNQQRNELQKLNDFKNKLFSLIGHDLRSPFASLKNLFLVAQTSQMDDAEMKNLIRLVEEKCDFANNLLNNVFLWASSQLNGEKIKLEPLKIRNLIEENQQLLAPILEQKNLRIENRISETVVPLTEKERLNFVLRNLISNAIKYSFPNNTIYLEATETSENVIISVIDQGIGIPEADLTKLFNEKRFSTQGTDGEKGTGLGLILCQELLESINARISVESKPGAGTVFHINLPNSQLITNKLEEVAFA